MSNYTEFEQDFPSRCLRLLDDQLADAESGNLEVTFLLTIAAGMICMIADRVGLPAEARDDVRSHPTGNSCVRNRWEKYADTLGESLHTRIEAEVLTHMEYSPPAIRVEGDRPDQWSWQPMNPETSLRATFSLIRNALAHGNIWTEPDHRGRIVRIVLAAKTDAPKNLPKPHEALRLPPKVLHRLLRTWAALFGGLQTPRRQATHRNPRLGSQ
jgi:hypothetical protein